MHYFKIKLQIVKNSRLYSMNPVGYHRLLDSLTYSKMFGKSNFFQRNMKNAHDLEQENS